MFATLLFTAALAPAGHAPEASLLDCVPQDAYALTHCRNIGAFRARAERNDWYRLLGSSHGEPILGELMHEIGSLTHSESNLLLPIADKLEGELVCFDSGSVAGLLVEPPADRAALAESVRAWMPQGDAALSRTVEISGGTAELAAWPDGWRSGHYAAFVDHPGVMAIFSGDDSAALLACVTETLGRFGAGERAPVVTAYLEAAGTDRSGIEVYIDFTPLIDPAEEVLRDALNDFLPDPTDLLGLEAGTWLHASLNLFEGTLVDCTARLHIPPGTVAASLADVFKPLPRTLPADLPKGVWGLWALNFDLKLFYQRAREAYAEAGLAEGLEPIDSGLDAARGISGIDPVADVLNQLAGDFAFYYVERPEGQPQGTGWFSRLEMLGAHIGLVDGNVFRNAFEQLLDVGDLGSVLEDEVIAGIDAYLFEAGESGGLAILPRAFTAGLTRHVLEANLNALARVDGAALPFGSLTQGALDGNPRACFLTCAEMRPLRTHAFPDLDDDLRLPPLEPGQPTRDPFDAQIIATAERTSDGFVFHLRTR